MKKPTECPYCQSSVEFTSNDKLYGRLYGKWPYCYLCTNTKCKASVGVHPNTKTPLGTLANDKLKKMRISVKIPFIETYESKKISRSEAYKQLGEIMGISADECHFGLFDEDMCLKAKPAVDILRERIRLK